VEKKVSFVGINISVTNLSLSSTQEKRLKTKTLCQTILLFEFNDETNHFSCYMSKRISKAEQQLRKSSGTCLRILLIP